MSTVTTLEFHTPRRRFSPRLYLQEMRAELLKTLRLPAYVAPTLGFPLAFYFLFGISFGASKTAGTVSMAQYLLATYGAFGVIGATLFGFGVGVAIERGQGWLQVKRASPMPIAAYFAGKLALSLVFSALIVAGLFTLGATAGNVRMPAGQWVALGATLIAGALPFGALGLAFGYWTGPNSAAPMVNLLYLVMAFAGGLWVPLPALPRLFQIVAPWLPTYHFGQLALARIGAAGTPASGPHVLYLALFTVGCLLLAGLGARRHEDRSFG